ncbi:MAG TPA: hypothetical protein VJ740_11500, partial [Hyphomicrobiaceae bacterium]|nr:hypothetical protein [Hyphomicrobiaceae bacterium]
MRAICAGASIRGDPDLRSAAFRSAGAAAIRARLPSPARARPNGGRTRPAKRKSAARGQAGKRTSPSQPQLAELKQRLREIGDLGSVSALLGWDQATYMPAGGAAARARQGALLSRLAHERSTHPALGK